MGTNFYLLTKEKKAAQKFAPYSYTLTDEPYFCYQIHIAKTSAGWLPLFQAHKDGIHSVSDLRSAVSSGDFEIIDEYGVFYDWEQFSKRVLEWNGGIYGRARRQEIPYNSPFADSRMPKYTPVTHLGGTEQSYCYEPWHAAYYFADPYGYEFCETEFS